MSIDMLLLPVVGLVTFYVAQFIFKKLKVAPPITYLVIGIIVGVSFLNIFPGEFFKNVTSYNTQGLWLLFVGAGFSLGVREIKTSGSKALKLSIFPVYLDAVVMSFVIYGLINVLPWYDLEFRYVDALIISTLLAAASPANVIPIVSGHVARGHVGNQNIGPNMIIASVLDNFTSMPLMLAAIGIAAGPALGLGDTTPIILLNSVLFAILFAIIGLIIGIVSVKLLTALFSKNIATNKYIAIVSAILFFAIFLFTMKGLSKIPVLATPLSFFAILSAVFAGAGFHNFDKEKIGPHVKKYLQMGFGMFVMPIVFLGVGSSIQISSLLSGQVIILGIIVTISTVALKSMGTMLAMTDKGYTMNDKKFAICCFLPKGITLVNLAGLIGVLIPATQYGTYNVMTMLAPFVIIITLPLGVTMMVKGEKLLMKKDG